MHFKFAAAVNFLVGVGVNVSNSTSFCVNNSYNTCDSLTPSYSRIIKKQLHFTKKKHLNVTRRSLKDCFQYTERSLFSISGPGITSCTFLHQMLCRSPSLSKPKCLWVKGRPALMKSKLTFIIEYQFQLFYGRIFDYFKELLLSSLNQLNPGMACY